MLWCVFLQRLGKGTKCAKRTSPFIVAKKKDNRRQIDSKHGLYVSVEPIYINIAFQ
jgi:hypothetical protein